MKNYFIEMKESGKLYIDRIFFESYYPVLFSCKNKLDEHFMCVCCQNNGDGQKWLLGKVDVHTIIKMLKNEITVRDLFLKHTSSKVSINTINGEFHQHYNNDDWSNDSIYLPKADSYLDPDEGEFDEDIEYYRQEQRKKYNNSTFLSYKEISIMIVSSLHTQYTNHNSKLYKRIEINDKQQCNSPEYLTLAA
ncbi:MAG: DUF6575 domain-containing protein [Treponema sp.]